MQSTKEITRLLGKQVEVTLDHAGPVVARGRFLSYHEYGEIVLQDEDGSIGWSWPALHVREVK